MGRRFSRITATVDVDLYLSDIIDQISDDELKAELMRRNQPISDASEKIIEAARELYDAVLRRDCASAQVILEQLLMPKWRTLAACQIEYEGLFPKAKKAA